MSWEMLWTKFLWKCNLFKSLFPFLQNVHETWWGGWWDGGWGGAAGGGGARLHRPQHLLHQLQRLGPGPRHRGARAGNPQLAFTCTFTWPLTFPLPRHDLIWSVTAVSTCAFICTLSVIFWQVSGALSFNSCRNFTNFFLWIFWGFYWPWAMTFS